MITTARLYLATSGAMLTLIGAYIGLDTAAYLQQFDLAPIRHTGFLNELRAFGGSLMLFGIFALAGSVVKPLQHSAIMAMTLLFSSYAVFRVIAIALDGVPGNAILLAAAIEFSFAFIGALLLKRQPAAVRTGPAV